MTIPNAEFVNTNYGNSLNYNNPIFKNIISNLISSGLFGENLANGSDARLGILNPETNTLEGGIQTYTNVNGDPSTAIALEVIVDCISRAIIKGYQEGFSQVIPSDGSSNINFKEDVLEMPFTIGLDLQSSKNVHEAILVLAREISQIKIALASLGCNLPPQLNLTSPSAHVK